MKATNATKLAVDELSTDRDSEVTGLVGLEAGAFYGTNGANLLNTEPSSYRIVFSAQREAAAAATRCRLVRDRN